MEEVAPMRLNTIERPSTLLAAVCAPSASWLPESTPVVALLAAERVQAPQAHQVQIQAELVRTLGDVDGSFGSTGFVGSNGISKRMTDGASGVPPRGRPV
jgi:hypothetical protein